MVEEFYNPASIIIGIIKLLILSAIGYIANKKGLISKDAIHALNKIVLWLCLPALIISRTISSFDPRTMRYWWVLPLASLAMSALGGLLGFIVQGFLKGELPRKEFISSCAFQNCGYLPIALVAFICSGEYCNLMLIYIFLFITGFNLVFWGLVPAYLSKKNDGIKLKSILNPPLVAMVFSVASIFLFGKGWLPEIIYSPLDMLGSTTFVIVLLALGAYLAEQGEYIPKKPIFLALCVSIKLLILPLAVLGILMLMPVEISYKFFIFLQSMMPVATSLVIVGLYKDADTRFYGFAIFYSHIIAIITIPLWLLVFRSIMQAY
jgi:malate permease and related proteins